eukprot:TRINITY_DN9820_c0_g1_i2.p1 TRINITY_DN9820_c0_g1~~TRINITY_DN9820_c0_g1_i2.p1  ORF type:complete len:319 (-),score=74.33 TRINITY_DN9820_c0_g1_i2:15-971(-)
MSGAVPLFIPSPNQRNNFGNTREMYVPNPSCKGAYLQQYRFLGRLMAGCLTINEYLTLSLPSLVWKALVDDPADRTDLSAIDQMCVKCLDDLCTIDRKGVTPEDFGDMFAETFKTVLSDGSEVELLPGGKNREVTFEDRQLYSKLVLDCRLNESRQQLLAMRHGMLDVLPPHFLALLTWQELERRVCGVPEIDIEELKRSAIYEDIDEDSKTCTYFWDALSSFTQQDLQMLLRFIAGRSRLPVQIKIQQMSTQGNPDAYLPQAHTCFFSIELPAYNSVDAMRQKLLYSIYNCRVIDTDGEPTDTMADDDDDDELDDEM